MDDVVLHHGDCLAVLPTLAACSIDAIVTDPPYGLAFMGKDWDHGVPGQHFWQEALRVAKPGSHLLAFGGTRTFHRLAVAIEDAGWEIRDTIMWVYGSGFPKSLDVSKAIDKAAGAEREVVGPSARHVSGKPGQRTDGLNGTSTFAERVGMGASITAPATDAARQWQGFGTALKPAWEPVIVARKPLAGTVAENVLAWGVGGINVDGCRIGIESTSRKDPRNGNLTNAHFEMRPWMKRRIEAGLPLKGDFDGSQGRWPANVVLSHSPDCRHVGTKRVKVAVGVGDRDKRGTRHGWVDGRESERDDVHPGYPDAEGMETVEDWVCAEGCAVRALDEASGERRGGGYPAAGLQRKHYGIYGKPDLTRSGMIGPSVGGASRFFYCAKASGADRDEGLEGFEERDCGMMEDDAYPIRTGSGNLRETKRRNHHPTVKPTELMRWLVRLVTPPGGTVLDPFMGSGSTGKAAMMEGLGFVGIELDREYVELARRRIDAVRLPLFSLESEG